MSSPTSGGHILLIEDLAEDLGLLDVIRTSVAHATLSKECQPCSERRN